jgi:dienelactone hydrolase
MLLPETFTSLIFGKGVYYNPYFTIEEFTGKGGLGMKKGIVMGILLLFLVGVALAYAGESITFKGTSKKDEPFMLKGILTRPQGQGPFPAIVMLSGGRGFHDAHSKWIERFVNWGYVALQVETLSSRGLSEIFGGFGLVIGPREAAQDAYDAKTYLSGLPYVDANRIALIGWAYGAWAALPAIDPTIPFQNRGKPFKAAVAFYPLCDQPLMGFDAPLLILHGALDTWHPVMRCRIIEGRNEQEIIMKIYPSAYICFDMEGIDKTDMGHRLLYDAAATADAVEQVKNFLAKHFK